MGAEPAGFAEFVSARGPALLRTAWMLTGDAHLAEDLLQAALARTWPHWERVRDGHPEAYVRQVMVRQQRSWWGRRWRGEAPTSDLTTLAGGQSDATDDVDERLRLTAALALLTPGQRQAVTLRYLDDLSVEETARVMGVSAGTVKSQAAKGLARLRVALDGVPQREESR